MKIYSEYKTLSVMINLFCRDHHGSIKTCRSCSELLDYAKERLSKCPFKNNKPTCQSCPVHCYNHEMRRRTIEVMRYSGPRMIYRHPFMAMGHMLKTIKSRKTVQKTLNNPT